MRRSILRKAAIDCLEAMRANGLRLATAESCTGGLISGWLTEIPGSSDILDRTFVTYSNAAKTEMLGVPADMLESKGAVSDEVARAMAEGALKRAGVDLAVSATGIAGPGGETEDKAVGLVYIGLAGRGIATDATCHLMPGDREDVRSATVLEALERLTDAAQRPGTWVSERSAAARGAA
ncbi:MAG: CinA family protein [Pseudomonadota bacterium]